jgi:hypothetical protein
MNNLKFYRHRDCLGEGQDCIEIGTGNEASDENSIAYILDPKDTATASLFAAAPELLEALEKLVTMIDNAPFELDPSQERNRVAAHAAIAKAKGGAK